ncbi:N-acetyltransferase family protein [Candidatus Bipolaricaulota sp. J31]
MEIRGIQREDVPRAMELLREAFATELSTWGANLARAERLLQFLLALDRLPLRALWLLGLRFEVWVAREGGEVVGVLGQFEGRPPVLSGIAVAREARGRGVAKALMRHAFADLKAKGAPLVLGSVRADNTAALELCSSVGMEPYGRVRIYSVPIPPRALPVVPKGITVRAGTREDVRRLIPPDTGKDSLRRLSRLNAAFAPWPLRLVGIRRSAIAVEVRGELAGFMALQTGRYWGGATVQAPILLREEAGVFLALLSAATAEVMRRRQGHAYFVLPDDLWRYSGALEHMGGEPIGEWVQLVRFLEIGDERRR